nr:helicase-related protein [Pectobacterium colocasium]
MHGNKSQGARTRALANFKDGSIRACWLQRISPRAVWISNQLPHVVNYELPNVPEDYVHRIGRTGRAEATGEALSLVCVDEHKLLRDIERLLKREIPRIAIEGYEPDPSIKAEPIVNGRQGNRGGGGARNGSPRAQSGAPRGQSERSQGQGERRSADGNRQPRKAGGNGDSPWGGNSGNKGNSGKGNGEGQRRAPRPQNRSKPADK